MLKALRFLKNGFFTVVMVCARHPELARFVKTLALALVDGKLEAHEKVKIKAKFDDLIDRYF